MARPTQEQRLGEHGSDKPTASKSKLNGGLCLGKLKDEKLDEMAGEIESVIRKHAEKEDVTFAGIIGTLELIKDDFKEEARKA